MLFTFWLDFINSLMKKDDSSHLAAGRLKGAIFLDRLSLSPATLDRIRDDVVRTISRYLIIDENAMTLAVQAQGRTVALAASIPVVSPRPPEAEEVLVPTTAAALEASETTDTSDRYERARARALRRKRRRSTVD